MQRLPLRLIGALVLTLCVAPAALTPAVGTADWPMWRFDAQRSGASPHALPERLQLQWARDYPPLQPAWPDQEKMQLDVAYEPVVWGRTLLLNSSRHDCVRALDTRTGLEKWTCFADGPVRFAPVAWEGRLYFASDDGYLYCLDRETGRQLWKFRGGPGDRKVLGNERLISTWPARGAPVVADGTVYFAASIWPFMGVFVHALDARTGAVRWTNDGDGSIYLAQPHNAEAFAGVAPQGPMVVAGDRLLVPGGRSIPACLDRRTGKLLRYQLAENGKRGGGPEVFALRDVYFNGGAVFDLATQKFLGDFSKQVVLTADVAYACAGGKVRAYDLRSIPAPPPVEDKDKAAKPKPSWTPAELASCPMPAVEAIIKAGPRLYLGGAGEVLAVDVNSDSQELTIAGTWPVDGRVVRLAAADERLFAVTREGRIYCFGEGGGQPQMYPWTSEPSPDADLAAERKAEAILKAAPAREGYAVLWGLGDGRLLHELVRQSQFHLIVVEPSEAKVLEARADLTREDLYGSRVSIVPGRPETVTLPPYLASVMVCEDPGVLGDQPAEDFLKRAVQSLRPFGGVACFDPLPALEEKLSAVVAKLPGGQMKSQDGLALLIREGALPGAGNWTHEHADAANTRVSPDQIVKAPLGLLWFGGPSHDSILPRHGHGPQPQVIDGRLIIEGVDLLRALDIYTGRMLWEAPLPGVGALYNNLAHQPGANASGGNFVCTPDSIYVAYKHGCVRLDPATGNRIDEFHLPVAPGENGPPLWGYLSVEGDYLIGGADPLFDPKLVPAAAANNGNDPEPGKGGALAKALKTLKGFTGDNYVSSQRLVVMDRRSGKVLWQTSARDGFRHNATAVGGGRLFTIDRLSGDQLARLKLKDADAPAPRLLAFDLKTGEPLWSAEADVFGTWLSYSAKHDVLVESGRVNRDSLFDEPRGMRAYRGADGKVLWHEKTYLGPAMIHGDTVLQDQGGCDLLSGALKMREDPITGALVPWKWTRGYGCNTPAASEHLLTFRSGAAGYFDLCNDGGTGNFGGFRSSCTNNLIVAGGVLTVPEYTRTCVCAYQNQTSVGLVPMPEAEMWTYFGTKEVKGAVKRLGLAFGAPGDRRADNGTLWLEYPSTGGASPSVTVTAKPAGVELFRRHPAFIQGPYNWVAASGFKGVREVTVGLGDTGGPPRRFTVKLVFAETDELKAGQRVFDVQVQGKTVLKGFDIVNEAGAARRSLIKEFPGVQAAGQLVVRLTPSAGAAVRSPILCGIEIIAENP
jgi:outer membrane protein assembly factor BamB